MIDRQGGRSHFNQQGLLTSRLDRVGNATTFDDIDLDEKGVPDALSGMVEPGGRTTTFAYSGGRLQTITDFAGRATAMTYDAAGRLTALTHAQGVTTLAGYTWIYGAPHRVTEFTSLVDRTVGRRGGESDGEKPRASAAAAHCRRRAGLEVFRADHAAGDEPPRLAAG